MVLNDLGKITEQCWNEIPKHYPNVGLDYCVIMPNHVHGIIIINDFVETGYIPSLRELKKHSLGGIVGKFKAAVTREIRKSININFHWQSQFYDRPKQ
jgi:REP element-mobilizing transposase RayT